MLLRILLIFAWLLVFAFPMSAADGVSKQIPTTVYVRKESVARDKSGPAQALRQKVRNAPLSILPVIVGVDMTLQSVNRLSSQAALRQRRSLEAVQDAVVSRVYGTGRRSRTIHRYRHIPFIAMRVDEHELEQLYRDPQVLTIKDSAKFQLLLSDSRKIVRAAGLQRRTDEDGNSIKGTGWAIAVLDTGVDTRYRNRDGRYVGHRMFRDRAVVAGACFSNTDGRGTSICRNGKVRQIGINASLHDCDTVQRKCHHGTRVASIAAGRPLHTDGGERLRGIAHAANIISIQTTTIFEDGGELKLVPFESDVIKGLEHVLDLSSQFKIAAVNLSLGWLVGGDCDRFSPAFVDVFRKLKAANIAVVVGTGNDGLDGIIRLPACISGAIAVGATDKSDNLWASSNHSVLVDLLAPGVDITGATTDGNRRATATASGTSYAAPHVAGAIALLRQVDPNATVDTIEHALSCTGRLIVDDRTSVKRPLINVKRAAVYLEHLRDNLVTSDVSIPLRCFQDLRRLIAAGNKHTCALTKANRIKCWGRGLEGQLGNGTTTAQPSPVQITAISTDIMTITTGGLHSCALTRNGAAWCWGLGNVGQLGNGSQLNSSTPVPVEGLSRGVIAIAAGGPHSSTTTNGGSHTCAVTGAGAVKCWGEGRYGQLGNGSTANQSTPAPVRGLTSGVVAVTTGRYHTCALTRRGAVKCWGDGSSGQLGNGSISNQSTPVAVNGLSSGVIAIEAGNDHTCAVTRSGAAMCWGAGGALGNGSSTDRLEPHFVTGLLSDVVAITAGGLHSCALTRLGAVKCWGLAANGRLGNGSAANKNQLAPLPVSGMSSGAIAVTAGGAHTCAMIGNDHTVKCWGSGSYYQIGNGATNDQLTPVDVVNF